MIWIIIGLFLVLLSAALLGVLAGVATKKGTNARSGLFASRNSILTPYETAFHALLTGALPPGYTINPMVRISDIVKVSKKFGNSVYQTNFNKCCMKHVDFLITKGPCIIAFAIELDDSSHNRPDRIDRDQYLDHVFKEAGIPLIHVTGNVMSMSAEELRSRLPILSNPM